MDGTVGALMAGEWFDRKGGGRGLRYLGTGPEHMLANLTP